MTIQQMSQGGRPGSTQSAGGASWAPMGAQQEADGRQGSEMTNGMEGRVARALGWFSIGLGLAEVAAPRSLAQLIGLRDDDKTRAVMRTMGLREIGTGVGILTQPKPSGWLWGRVAGDVLDLALLAMAPKADGARRNRTTMAMAAVVGVTALDLLYSVRLSRHPDTQARGMLQDRGVHVRKSITINRSPEEVYRFWRDFQNLPRFMAHLEGVRVTGEKRSHWQAKAPLGMTVEWDAEIIDDRPNELIAWRALEGADVDNSGAVRFRRAPGGRGTEVTVDIQYRPPGGVIGATVAKLFGEEPGQQVQDDLRRLKQIMEIGEIVMSEGLVSGSARPPREVPSHHRP